MIGGGSFGRVFKGEDKQTGKVVALKLIPKVGLLETVGVAGEGDSGGPPLPPHQQGPPPGHQASGAPRL